jgi:hypothetical protein
MNSSTASRRHDPESPNPSTKPGQLQGRLWTYRKDHFRGEEQLFDSAHAAHTGPPVFLGEYAELNVLVAPDASPAERARVRGMLDPRLRHRWFRSLRSSQALAQSVFANLEARGKLHCLAGLPADDHDIAFFDETEPTPKLALDHPIKHLGEPRSTSVDVFLSGVRRVAIECKFGETAVGACSRPDPQTEPAKRCNGRYEAQAGRRERCSLTTDGVAYWTYVPRIFTWAADVNYDDCPLRKPYQLVRTVLAACVGEDGIVEGAHHALLLYDRRNPSFNAGGAGFHAYDAVKGALRRPDALRRCSWQSVSRRLAGESSLRWLVDGLEAKYGLTDRGVPSREGV